MKKSKSNSKRQNSRTKRSLSGFEGLEERRVLAANLLASGVSSVAANVTQDVTMTVATPDATAGSEAVLAIDVSADSGSSLDPGAITILDSSGASVATTFSNNDASGTSSQATVSLPAGVYTLQVSGENGTAGSYTVGVSLPGDITTGDGTVGAVSAAELSAAQLSFASAAGTGNFVTDLFNRVHGIDPDNVDTGFDTNGDGVLDAADLAAIQQNADVGTVTVVIEADNDGPEISNIRLTSDTGSSATDQITTNPSLLVDISDNSLITGVTASVNGGTAIDISSLVGDFNSTGSLLLEASDLSAINGGTTLADGVVTVELIGTDVLGNVSGPTTFTFNLINNNSAPTTFGIADQSATEDTAFGLNVTALFTDSNVGDILTFTASGLPAWLTLGASTGVLTGTPANADVGTTTVTITATDTQNASVSDTFDLVVANTNDAPVATAINGQDAAEDVAFTLNLNNFFSDDDGDALSFTAVQATGFDAAGNILNGSALPSWLTISNGILSGTPSDGDAGSFQVAVVAVDPSGATGNALISFNVGGVNDAPTLVSAIPDQSATEDTAFSLDLSPFFADADPSDTLSFIATGLPASFSINGSILSGNPDDAAVGTSNITITATDTFQASVSDSLVLTVANVNDVPVAADASFTVNETAVNGTSVGTVSATDNDASETLAFAITGGDPNGIFAINSSTGEITVANASLLVAGVTQNLTVQVTDSASATDTATVNVVVNGVSNDLIEYRLEVLDANGIVTTSVAPGSTFTLVAFAEDLQASPQGVFAAFLDVNYPSALVTVNGSIDASMSPYPNGRSGSNATPGLLDEVGGFDGLTPLGAGEQEVFRQEFTAGSAAGVVNFTSDEPEMVPQNDTLVFGQNAGIPASQIDFGSVTLTIAGANASAGIVFNPHDVNQDGFVSPLDALLVINELNGNSVGLVGADVNGDGGVTPVDALLVINDLFLGSAGGSNVLVGDDSDVSEAALADALEFVFEELATDIQADPSATAAMLTDIDSPLVDSIYDVINADESEQDSLWDDLADDLAALLSNV